ncbi:hypothetical protein PMAYCL1PPCAC_13813, partial [Pristionchus mayeri]
RSDQLLRSAPSPFLRSDQLLRSAPSPFLFGSPRGTITVVLQLLQVLHLSCGFLENDNEGASEVEEIQSLAVGDHSRLHAMDRIVKGVDLLGAFI